MLEGGPAPKARVRTVGEALLAARTSGSEEGLTFVGLDERETFYPWPDLVDRAERVAGRLVQLGVQPGDRVGLVLPTSVGFMDAYFGVTLAGAVPVPLYPPVRLGRMGEYHASTARMLKTADVCMVLTDGRVRRLLGQAIAEAAPALGCRMIEEVLESSVTRAAVETTPEALALTQFSSGSTVAPKAVALSHANVIAQCATLEAGFPPGENDERPVGVSWLPLYHDMGLIGGLLTALYCGGHLVLLPPEHFLARPALWLRALSRHRAVISPAPNFAYAVCLKRVKDADLEGVDLSQWKLALNGAEPVSAEVLRKFAERFGPYGLPEHALMPVYGLAEASLAVTFSSWQGPWKEARVDAETLARDGVAQEGARSIVSVGRPVPGVQVEIRGENGETLGDDQRGRVLARGPAIMTGYFRDEAATRAALTKDGWLDTGDLGFTRGGELYLCGRAKDLVIIRGANHAPQEFEDCLEGLDGVRAGCAVALGFHPPGEESEALLVLAEHPSGETAASEESIRKVILERTGVRAHTVRVLAPGTLPRTSSGKLRRSEALHRFLGGTLQAPKSVNLLTVGTELLKSAWAMPATR